MSYSLTSIISRKETNLSWDEYHAAYAMHFDIYLWPRVLILAENYGWKPAGTLPSNRIPWAKPSNWNGSYTAACEDQIVSIGDASALAYALENALVDISDQECEKPKRIMINTIEDAQQHLKKSGDPFMMIGLMLGFFDPSKGVEVFNHELSPMELFSGKDKQLIVDLIALCRKGAFRIN